MYDKLVNFYREDPSTGTSATYITTVTVAPRHSFVSIAAHQRAFAARHSFEVSACLPASTNEHAYRLLNRTSAILCEVHLCHRKRQLLLKLTELRRLLIQDSALLRSNGPNRCEGRTVVIWLRWCISLTLSLEKLIGSASGPLWNVPGQSNRLRFI